MKTYLETIASDADRIEISGATANAIYAEFYAAIPELAKVMPRKFADTAMIALVKNDKGYEWCYDDTH